MQAAINTELNRSPVITIAEDDLDDTFLLKRAFKETGSLSELRFVKDGRELIQYIQRQPPFNDNQLYPFPDLILLDLNMPNVDGRESLEWIKGNVQYNHIPIIVLTTSSNEADILSAYDLGANSYITKPNNFKAFIEIVHTIHQYWFTTVKLPLISN
ncbi:response regulator [Aliikangiella maris]|uniref:Response regulator n=2 Tax=Aliikangiella maris TaxID=3162458 RepID=A0ABV2BWA7_9GAMM